MQATHRQTALAGPSLRPAAPFFEGYLGIPGQLLLKHLVIASFLSLVASLLLIPNLKTFLAGSVGAVVLILPLFESAKSNLRNLLSRLPKLSLAICLVVVLYMLAATLSTIIQTYEEGGIMMAVIHGAASPLLAAACLTACLACSHPSPTHGLLLLAMTVAFICLGNQVADILGIGSEYLKSREAFWASRYLEGSFRWQSPLLSSWQLSGQGRWALPLLLVPLLARGSRRVALTAFLPLAAVVAVALVRIEFRAAVFPLLGFIGWSLCKGQRLRGVLAAGMYAYMIAAPFIFGSPTFLNLAERLIPEFIIRLSGASLENILSLTERTTLWLLALEDLTAGHTLLSGQGYYGLDASIFGAWDLGGLAELIAKYSFHQGFLDLCFIFGSFWATLLILGVGLSFRTLGQPPPPLLSPRSLGWLSLGLIGLSNCHDGFFTPNFMFFTITLFSVICAGTPTTDHRSSHDGFPEKP